MKQSWAVLKHDRELIWLPVISALVAGIVAAIILIPVGLSQDWDAVSGTGESASQQVGGGVYLAIAGLTLALA
ncbi:MAG: hypothetical protein HOI41_11335, partial [Acidimicrobiaceae bacterium]|nr:hypothetical protein [Acidimicrobiaceae bacterium]